MIGFASPGCPEHCETAKACLLTRPTILVPRTQRSAPPAMRSIVRFSDALQSRAHVAAHVLCRSSVPNALQR
ncbi:hypothetical protein AB7M16_006408 [Bradyrhizobium sp. USDA 372]